MFRTDLLSIIRSLNTVFTAIGICHTSYVDCLLARSGCNVKHTIKIHKIRLKNSDARNLSLLRCWYGTCVADGTHHTSTWSPCICPIIKSKLISRRRRNRYVCWQAETACFTLVSDANRLPAWRFLRLLWDRNHCAPYCQPDWRLVMDHSQQLRSFVAYAILNDSTGVSGCNSLVWVDVKK
jgi:hypothetical protein